MKLALGAAFAALTALPALAETRLKLAHVANTDDPVHAAALTFARVAGDLSDGELNVRVFPNSQLGKAKEALDGVQLGTVDITMDALGALSAYHPAAGLDSMPYLFKDADHYMEVWSGPVGTEIKELFASEANFRVMGHLFRGSRELTSNKRVDSIDDLAGLKIRVTPITERLETWKAFGASPTPMAWSEVFTALQQGVIEAQENPVAVALTQKLYEVQKYMVLTSHMANGFTFIMNDKKFQAMPKEHQIAIRGAALAAAAEFRAKVKAEREIMLEELKRLGMEVIEIDQAPFEAKAKDVVALFPDLQPWYEKMQAQ
ncbi:TRAP transporter substrate-binding protein [Mameliella sediminis]|uniref:TRAP transporter substrate-binding protein n=1 Tax=Mameliella sediminis TaxID=2836866 RepID=UPI001C475EFD|nr:TRAP transporter substrate-binding protein [Mameliella sediminis]MBV7395940.1 TRAP transporter substrate-binding protein [Mameliella sediminis]MBY6144825.1 TRAP transporter substrate-binding protein [Mameliella alba]MBY6173957.1 TRAP transporter substrate-binding protein [Mameliella alba]MCA0956434.1 TRAP transporter substrate-binding protein [Mameliella alba]